MCYRKELLDWNTRVNLTAITTPEDVLTKHFLDLLSVLKVYNEPRARLLDIGSGAGFPGLPLKIMRPQWEVVLLEATGKKVMFLKHMIETLHLENVVVIQGRAEEFAHKQEYRATFDVVTGTSGGLTSNTSRSIDSTICRVHGQIVLLKKGALEDEITLGKRAAKEVGAVLKSDVAVTLPGLTDSRRLLVWEQQKLCPKQYPRGGAAMAKIR